MRTTGARRSPKRRRVTQLSETRGTYTLTGCRPVPMTDAEVAAYDGRMEYWDGETETAWELHDHSRYHEGACFRVSQLVDRVAMFRGAPIELLGTTDLQERDASGKRKQVAQADELIYLDGRNRPRGAVVVIGESPLPDVVVEVDLTTDVRDRKLKLYAKWGIPELWVEVPEARMPSRRKRPGLAIRVLDGGKFRERDESVAFPTWEADEIHHSLNEPFLSTMTVRQLRRVGEIMGRQTGTDPDDDPVMDEHGRSKHAEGFRDGREQGRREIALEGLENTLALRNIRIGGRLADDADRILAAPNAAAVEAALRCRDYGDFISRIRGAAPLAG